ncbi:predicted protein, partial [Arabidopsis lyrata subsp. lyrata]
MELLPCSSGSAPIIRIFGVTREVYVAVFMGLSLIFTLRAHVYKIGLSIEERMRKSNRSSKVSKFVHHIELVQKKSIMYYQQQKSENFLKIVIALPSMESTCL